MPTLKLPTPLRPYANNQSEIRLDGATAAEAVADLLRQYPALKPHLTNEAGELRPYVNLFLGEDNLKDLQGLQTTLQEGDRLLLIPSIAGG